MKKLYPLLQVALCACTLIPHLTKAQSCASLYADAVAYESRCASTGSIKVTAGGGTGSYKYRVIGPVTSNFTSLDSITGLPPGMYNVVVNDIITNCSYTIEEVEVTGNYQDPRFTLIKTDVSCDNGSNASISATSIQFGRPPFSFSIVAPSPMGVGTTNSTGVFTDLKAGDYTIRLTDSCGGIQTRLITVNNYTWYIDAYPFTQNSCTNVTGYIRVIDSKGNSSTSGGIPGFMYGVVRFEGDTIWSSNPNFSFNPNGAQQLGIVAKDACGKIKKAGTLVSFVASLGNTVTVTPTSCSTFTASLTNIKNFYDPQYCLYDNNNNQLDCNSSGTFSGLAFGSYCITARDACTDTLITRCFTASAPVIAAGSNVAISNRTCNTFTAAITNKVGLTNANFCLYDDADNLINCNLTGAFNNLTYGDYCIKITDGCADSTIVRCFTALRPRPSMPNTVNPAYTNCENFGIVIRGDSLSSPTYCLIDSAGNQLLCNSTGVFDSIPYGDYCVTVYDACYDTTIVRCFSILTGYVQNDIQVNIQNRACSTFTVVAASNNIINGQYCLYNAQDSLIACNNSGVFDSILYGAYCIRSTNICPDTTFTNCFSAYPFVPSVNATVQQSNKNCNGFTATITNQQNLTDPQFCIYNDADSLLDCNTNGIFSNLAYGSYCIKITNSCYDTVITRCFTANPTPVDLSLQLRKSCVYGYARFTFTLANAGFPVNLRIYNPDGSLYLSRHYNSSTINIDSIPELTGSDKYKVTVNDNCGGMDSLTTGAVASKLLHSASVINKCPSATWLNGSGNIRATVTTNLGSISVRIIKKNNVTYNPSLNPNNSSGGVYNFNDLGPGTYIVRYRPNDNCGATLYDTVTIQPYHYPSLNRSTAYQCDTDGFTVSAVVDYGIAPFSYEIIGSSPAVPSIVAGPQANPVFNINNGTSYSLIRLRVLDACGNASLEDASVLPLADNMITATFNCFQMPTTLKVDSVNGATYAWYKKNNAGDTDSIYIGTGPSVFIPELLPTDTGVYSAHISVNSGCLKRSYFYRLTGACFTYLPVVLKDFNGRYTNNAVQLSWSILQGTGLQKIVVEKQNAQGQFEPVHMINNVINSNYQQGYTYTDKLFLYGDNRYRLQLVSKTGTHTYSNIITVNSLKTAGAFTIYPNPATDKFIVQFSQVAGHRYRLQLLNALNQVILEKAVPTEAAGQLVVKRPGQVGAGVYFVRLVDTDTHESSVQKLVFRQEGH
jgi:hypothetical protein